MSVSGVDPAATNDIARIASQGVIQLTQALFKATADNQKVESREKDSALKKALAEKAPGISLAETVQRIASLFGNTQGDIAQKLTGDPARDLEEDVRRAVEQRESTDDHVEIGKGLMGVIRGRAGNRHSFSSMGGGRGEDGLIGQTLEEVQATIQAFQTAYESFLVGGGTSSRQEVERLERALQQMGVSASDIVEFRKAIATAVRHRVMQMLKQSARNQLLSQPKSIEFFLAKTAHQNIISYLVVDKNLPEVQRLGGWQFGGFHGDLQGAVNHAARETGSTMGTVAREGLDRAVMQQAIQHDQTLPDLEKEMEQWLQMAEKTGVSVKAYYQKLPRFLDDQGLLPRNDIALFHAQNGTAGHSGNGHQSPEQRAMFVASEVERREVLFDRLRAEVANQILQPGWGRALSLSFRVVKTKNGLLKLGVRSEDIDRVMKEGKELAKWKLFAQLREHFEERASIGDLESPAGELVEKKIRALLSNLDRLGLHLKDEHVVRMRDQANYKMFDILQVELANIQQGIRLRDIPYLRQREKFALQAMDRIAQESGIGWGGVARVGVNG